MSSRDKSCGTVQLPHTFDGFAISARSSGAYQDKQEKIRCSVCLDRRARRERTLTAELSKSRLSRSASRVQERSSASLQIQVLLHTSDVSPWRSCGSFSLDCVTHSKHYYYPFSGASSRGLTRKRLCDSARKGDPFDEFYRASLGAATLRIVSGVARFCPSRKRGI